MKVVIYARRSEDKENGESIKNQLSICRRYANIHYPNAIIDEYFDDDYSGRNMIRPEFNKVMKLLKKGYYDVFIFWKLDRVSRNTLDFLELHKKLEDLGVNIVSVTEGFDPSTPAGKLMMTMLISVAEMERKNISLRVSTTMNEMAKEGRWTGGRTPFGYTATEINGKKFLKANKKDINIVKSIFNKYFQCESLFATSKWLKQTYNIKKSPENIKRLLQNLVYVKSDKDIIKYLYNNGIKVYGEINGNGLISYGKVDKTKDIGYVNRSKSEWIVAVAKHEGIITGSEYINIFNILEKNTNCGRRGTGDITFLNGLCKCYYCGGYMRTKQKSGGKYRYFVCGNKDSMKNDCKNISIRIGDVEETVINKLINYKIKKINESKKTIDVSPFKKELEKKNKQIKNLIIKLSQVDDLEDIFLEQIRELKNECHILENTIKEMEVETLLNDVNSYNKDFFYNELKTFKSNFERCKTINDKRRLIKALVQEIRLDGINKKVEVGLKF